ncbi:Methyltransferase type 11 [Nitrosotalea sinensis]|uniref:Methyltransferase type 11 n=1 Tax=Nitrosotalea sinensis TaxID=1499975 RepID=A0A2H1EH81_9ARCH|nr:class I SAM-dependent methyltransferase [Candidatus Nitrosotalea sinensis]SHO46189.1 Methyltransferase type 11 [Candidatus Nitrosotalea sinensis]
MNNPNPIKVILWTLRRKENDVVNLYDYLAGVMQASTGGNFLNFGYWEENTSSPLEAQENLCRMAGKMAELDKTEFVLDVGSGFSEPSFLWKKDYPGIEITCININKNQLVEANKNQKSYKINPVNSTATKIPIASSTHDRIIALESAQHFKPLDDFISESNRILKKEGIMVIAIPILTRPSKVGIMQTGILQFTWSSEHYSLDIIKETIQEHDLEIMEIKMIGSKVYVPLADYYIKNRINLREKILDRYPSYVESILFKSMMKMKQAANDKIIEYALIKCKK